MTRRLRGAGDRRKGSLPGLRPGNLIRLALKLNKRSPQRHRGRGGKQNPEKEKLGLEVAQLFTIPCRQLSRLWVISQGTISTRARSFLLSFLCVLCASVVKMFLENWRFRWFMNMMS
jgi:hypothetical protein